MNYSGKDSKLKTMDIDTAKVLNVLIDKGVELGTIIEKFYHGKIYILESHNYVFVITGSTNLSRNAFRNNSEIDNLIIYNNNSNKHSMHFLNLWETGKQINKLDELKFSKLEINNFDDGSLVTIDEVTMKKKVLSITDDALKERLLLWLTYKPSNIYDKINVAEREYIAIEYKDRNMIVLESFYPSNAYFVFYDLKINELLRTIEGKSKTEIFNLSKMEKRGYHLREKLVLEIKIKTYFI